MALSRTWSGPFAWFNPEERGILPLEDFHISRRLAKRMRSGRFEITTDRAFGEVMLGCAAARPSSGEGRDDECRETWINDDMVLAYSALHEAGLAHSIEAWLREGVGTSGERAVLVGGIYGVHIGGAFFAESKFCRPDRGGTDASKVCLAHLVLHLRRRGFSLLDVQYWNEHLDQFGCIEISRAEYLKQLQRATHEEVTWLPF